MLFVTMLPMAATLLPSPHEGPRPDSFFFMMIGVLAMLVSMQIFLVFRHRSLAGHTLILSPDGLRYEPLTRKLGIDNIPWSELHTCYPLRNYGGGRPVMVYLRHGPFRDELVKSHPGFDGGFMIKTFHLQSSGAIYQDVSAGISGRLFKSPESPRGHETTR